MLCKKFLAEGKTNAWYHYASRPEWVEGEADERAIQWAKSLNTSLYIVHLANKQGVDAVTKAKQEGYAIYAETCPQYLEFTSDVYQSCTENPAKSQILSDFFAFYDTKNPWQTRKVGS